MENLSKNIRQMTKEKGHSLSWLAREIGVSKTGFFKMLEANSFKSDTLNKIAATLEVPVGTLVAGKDGFAVVFDGKNDEQNDQVGKMLVAFGSVFFLMKLKEYLDAAEQDESKGKADIIKELKELSKESFSSWAKENTLQKFNLP